MPGHRKSRVAQGLPVAMTAEEIQAKLAADPSWTPPAWWKPPREFTPDEGRATGRRNLEAGHRSPRVHRALAEELRGQLLVRRPDLGAYPEALDRFCSWQARALLLRNYLDSTGGDIGADGEVRQSLTSWLSACENNAAKVAASLGIDPVSEARLARERASASLVMVDLRALAQAGREALEGSATLPELTADTGTVRDPLDLAAEVLAEVLADQAGDAEGEQ